MMLMDWSSYFVISAQCIALHKGNTLVKVSNVTDFKCICHVSNMPFYISGLSYLNFFVKLVHLCCFHFFLYCIKVCSVVPSGGTNCEMQSNTGVIHSLWVAVA